MKKLRFTEVKRLTSQITQLVSNSNFNPDWSDSKALVFSTVLEYYWHKQVLDIQKLQTGSPLSACLLHFTEAQAL